jgi:hypothetical protein
MILSSWAVRTCLDDKQTDAGRHHSVTAVLRDCPSGSRDLAEAAELRFLHSVTAVPLSLCHCSTADSAVIVSAPSQCHYLLHNCSYAAIVSHLPVAHKPLRNSEQSPLLRRAFDMAGHHGRPNRGLDLLESAHVRREFVNHEGDALWILIPYAVLRVSVVFMKVRTALDYGPFRIRYAIYMVSLYDRSL